MHDLVGAVIRFVRILARASWLQFINRIHERLIIVGKEDLPDLIV